MCYNSFYGLYEFVLSMRDMIYYYVSIDWTRSFFFFFEFVFTIAFKPMTTAYDGCSYHHVKISIDF